MSDETRSHRRYFPLPLPIHSTACGKREREVDELHSPQTARQTSRAPYSSFPHSFVRPPAEPIPSSRPLFKHAGARSGRQGWRVSATVRLVLDGREHDGMLMRHGARQVATAAPQSPRWYSPQKLSACSLAHMHPTVVGLPCRLVLMVAPPGYPVDQPCDRQAPRAPLPQSGVTFMGKTSCAFSKGITLSSSLVRTHAPKLYPPSDFGLPLFERSLQVAASALLRKGSSQRYLCRPSLRAGTPTPAAPKVLSPVSSPGTLAFPE